MRNTIVICLLALLLTGCAAEESFETMMDEVSNPVRAEPMHILIDLPEEAAKQAMSSEENGSVYLCEDYVLTLQTLPGGDLHKTLREATGFEREELALIETVQEEATRYVCVWSSLGENGDQIGRCAVLDDGNYHYVLTAMADEEKAGKLSSGAWESVFSSFRLIEKEDMVNSGS